MARLNKNNLLCLLLAAVLVVLGFAASTASANMATYAFLMEFRDEYSYLRSRWPQNPSADYCQWEGISCDANGYVSIDLSNRGLDGDVPEFDDDDRNQGDQVMVTSINLSNNNKVDGDLDGDWQYLTNLKYLNLDNTRVDEDELPWEWANMNLEEIHIANARLCGSLPAWRMPNLRVVDFSNNRMGGTLSEAWSAMTNLNSVDISGNSFCGCVPSTWANVPALATAADNANAGLRASDCATVNRCGRTDRCVGSGGNGASGVASLVASVAAVATVVTVMVL